VWELEGDAYRCVGVAAGDEPLRLGRPFEVTVVPSALVT
jgi:hypothetical protein